MFCRNFVFRKINSQRSPDRAKSTDVPTVLNVNRIWYYGFLLFADRDFTFRLLSPRCRLTRGFQSLSWLRFRGQRSLISAVIARKRVYTLTDRGLRSFSPARKNGLDLSFFFFSKLSNWRVLRCFSRVLLLSFLIAF